MNTHIYLTLNSYRIKARNFENPPVDISQKTYEFIKNIKEIKDNNLPIEQTGKHFDFRSETHKNALVKHNINRVVSLYLNYLGVLRVNPISSHLSGKDFDLEYPHVFHKNYKLASPFIIRSEMSRDLKDNSNIR